MLPRIGCGPSGGLIGHLLNVGKGGLTHDNLRDAAINPMMSEGEPLSTDLSGGGKARQGAAARAGFTA